MAAVEDKQSKVNVLCQGQMKSVPVSRDQADEFQVRVFEDQIKHIQRDGPSASFLRMILDKESVEYYLAPIKKSTQNAELIKRIDAVQKFVGESEQPAGVSAAGVSPAGVSPAGQKD
jgi:hypothetical protein